MNFTPEPYEPCPCGSGKKYKFCCAKNRAKGKYPVGTIAHYGPDDRTCTKVVAGVITSENAEPILQRFMGAELDRDPKVIDQIQSFFLKHHVTNVVYAEGILGCPHEEGPDFPNGMDCPFRPF